jgi:Family of unknown function (DUF6502)
MTTKRTEWKSVLGETRILRIAEAVFVPLAHLFADSGVICPQAERLLRTVCVREAAVTEAKTRKRPNVSRIALLTGLDRKEVARLLRRPQQIEFRLHARSHPGDQVLEGWYSDPRFAGRGRPLALWIKGSKSKLPSFWSLANRYAPGVYPGLLLRELLRVGVVEALRDGRVRARTRRIERGERGRRRARELGAYLDDVLRALGSQVHRRELKTRQRTRRR